MHHLEKFRKLYAKAAIGGTVSINDLKERELNGLPLSPEEKKAIVTFDSFRIKELNNLSDEKLFHQRYQQLQVMANLSPFEEFLKEEYQ